jgi:S-adenosylmethionine:diacylglycerol 3-amino-3-carboxypropyl transferase
VPQVISTYIDDTHRDEILIEQLKVSAIGHARINSSSELLLYDNHVVVAVQGTSINKLYYIDRVFAEHSSAEVQKVWSFNRVSQGQNLEQVM